MANKTLLRILTVFGAICVLTLGFGCSSSDKATNNTTTSNLDQMEGLVDEDFYAMALQSLDLSLSLLDSIPVAGAPDDRQKTKLERLVAGEGDDLVINAIASYAYQNGWHIFQFAATIDPGDGSGVADMTGIDSVQVLQGGVPMGPEADFSLLDEVTSHAHFSWLSQDGATSVGANQLVNVTFDVVGSDTTFVVDGSFDQALSAVFEDSTSSCSFAIDVAAVVNDLAISNSDDCPQSGSVVMDVAIDLACLSTGGEGPQSLTVEGEMSVTAVANGNNSITVTYTDGVNTKTVMEQCGGAVVSPWSIPQF
jgi:hypothetical protein